MCVFFQSIMYIAHATGNSTHVFSLPAYIFIFSVHLLGVVLVIADESDYKNISFWFLMYTVTHGSMVFISSVLLLMRMLRFGSSVFRQFSFVRNLTSVIFLLAISIFHAHIYSDGTAFIVPRDMQDVSSRTHRLDFLLTSFYASVGILSSVGYGDIIPVVWYARLVILPNFMFTFLANAMIFSAFTKFYAKSERHANQLNERYIEE